MRQVNGGIFLIAVLGAIGIAFNIFQRIELSQIENPTFLVPETKQYSRGISVEWRNRVPPGLFGGLAGYSKRRKLPDAGFKLKDLRFCEVTARSGSIHDPQYDCIDDGTCESCISGISKNQTGPLIAAFHDKKMRARRDDLYRNFFAGSLEELDTTTISLVSIDENTVHMTLNWICSAEAVLLNSSQTLLVSVSSLEVYNIVVKAGLKAIHPDLNYDERKYPGKLPEKKNGFKWAMVNIMRTAAELVHAGYDVLIQDADVVWVRNPLPEIEKDPNFNYLDIISQEAVRFDSQGPINSGVIFLRSNTKTKIFMSSIVNSLSLVYHQSDDQRVWNHFVRHPFFRQIHFETFPASIVFGVFGDEKEDTNKMVRESISLIKPAILHRVGIQNKPATRKAMSLREYGLWKFNEKCFLKPSFFPKGTFSKSVRMIWETQDDENST